MKKRTIHLLGFIEFIILLLTLIFFVLANNKSMVYLVDKVTSAYDLKYEKLEGNLLKNLTLSGITYRGEDLAQKAHIDINFRSLLKAKIVIDDLTIQKMDLSVLEKMIEDQNRKNKKSKKLEYIPTITISSLFFSAKPYHKYDINIDSLKFVATDLRGDLTNLYIESFSFYTESDHTNITANGQLKDKILNFDHLWITDVDIEKVIEFYKDKIKDKNRKSNKDIDKTKERGFQNLVKELKIGNFKTDIKPYNYKKYNIKKLEVKATDFFTNLKSFNAKTSISADTNMWKLNSKGVLKDKRFTTDVTVILKDRYFKKFVPFFDHNKIKPIKLTIDINKDGLTSNAFLQSSNLMTGKLKDLNLSIKRAEAKANLSFKPINLDVKIDGLLSTKYCKNIPTKVNLYYDKVKKFTYDGRLLFKKFENLNTTAKELLQNTDVAFFGDTKKIQAKFENINFWADYNSTKYKNGILNIHLDRQTIKRELKLPKSLSNLELSANVVVPIDFKNLTKYNSDISIESNCLNIDGKLTYDSGFKLNAIATIPDNSILKNLDKNLKFKSLSNLKIDATLHNNTLTSKISNRDIFIDILYDLESKEIDSKIDIDKQIVKISGDIENTISFKAKTLSLKTLQQNAQKFYNFKKEPLDGEVILEGKIDKNNNLELNINSRWLVYEYKPNRFAFAEKIKAKLSKKNQQYILKNYYFSTYLDYDRVFFAKKPSLFSYKDNRIDIRNFWINDQANVLGSYDFKNQNGNFNLSAKSYHYNGREADIHADIALKSMIDRENINIDGNIELLSGVIKYKAKKKHYIQDDDIIIVQEERREKKIKKDSSVTVDVTLISKRPIRYKTDDTDVLLDCDLKFWKDKKSDLELLGMIKLLEGTHIEAKKEFKVQTGEILFAGDIFNPFLNINVTHQSDPYEITININGLLDSPIINFSSTPFLTQSDILSILLFDSTTQELFSSNKDSSKAALSMFGNTFAKEMVANFGIKLDKLVLSTNEEGGLGVEVGKKISRKVTIIYINDIVQTIKVKYQNSRRFETDITISPDSSGIDFLYKNEY